MPVMTRIPVPAWARPFSRTIDDRFGEAALASLLSQHEAILATAHDAIQDYVDENARGEADGSGGFPLEARLTGEYYIAEESYWVLDEPWFAQAGRQREYRFSLMARCLEPQSIAGNADRDYLGLEVHFSWLADQGSFAFDGSVDSSSI